MKRPSRLSLLAGVVLALALAACSGSPNPVLYTIAPVAGQQRNAGPKVVVLQQVRMFPDADRLMKEALRKFPQDHTEEEWHRVFIHPEQQREISLAEALELYVWHGRHHVAHITGLRQRMGW